jgi:hypothetical protein
MSVLACHRALIPVSLAIVSCAVVFWLFSGDDAAESMPVRPSLRSASSATGSPMQPMIDVAMGASALESQASSAGLPNARGSATEWNRRMARSRNESLQATVHRAAVLMKFGDIAAAIVAQRACVPFSAGPEQRKKLGFGEMPPEQAAQLQRRFENCGQAHVRSAGGIPVKDHEGFGDLAQTIIDVIGQRKSVKDNEELRLQILSAVRSTGSAELMLAAYGGIIKQSDLDRLGVPSRGSARNFDDGVLLHLALRIEACRAGGYCRDAALEEVDCSLMKSCVDSLEEFPAKRLYGSLEDRSPMYPTLRRAEPSVAEARWREVEAAARRLLSPP